MKFHFSIRTKLTFWYALILIGTFALFGSGAFFFTKETLSSSLDLTLRNEVEWLKGYLRERAEIRKKKKRPAKTPAKKNTQKSKAKEQSTIDSTLVSQQLGPWTEEDSIWYQIYEHAMRNPKKTLILVRDNRGKMFFQSSNLEDPDSIYIPEVAQKDTTILTTYFAKDGEERRLAYLTNSNGEIWVAYPLEDLETILKNLFRVFLVISPFAIVISVLGAWFIAKSSLRPVDEVTGIARKISAMNLDQQIPPRYIDDEIGRLIQTLNEMLLRLQNSFELTRQFSIDASHELRTPLTIMRGEIELLLHKEEPSDEEFREVLISVLDEVLRMNAIIESLMLLAKSDLNQYKPNWEPVDLHEIIEELYEDGTLLAMQKKIEVTLDHNEKISMSGDKLRLRQLFLNLLENAIKYTPECGKVSISLKKENAFAIIKISDSGIGIPQKELPKIFNRFYRVDKARSRELGGSGLGLSIAKWVTELHSGTISVYSVIHQGTTFTVKLPLATSHN
ncbi:MAG: ATP-binding protein [Bacteroidota bacterium]